MRKIFILLLMLSVSGTSFAQVKTAPFPSNWKELQGSDSGTLQTFALPESSPTSFPTDYKIIKNTTSISPPLSTIKNYGIYNSVINKWLALKTSFGFSFINLSDSSIDPLIIKNINNNGGNALFSKNDKGNYWCYIPTQEQTSDFIKIEFVDVSLNSCQESYEKTILIESNALKIAKAEAKQTDIQADCLTTNKPIPNGNGGLPGRHLGEPIPHISCGFPVGSPGAKDVQVPLNKPFDDDPIKVLPAIAKDFSAIPRFCNHCNVESDIKNPTVITATSIPNDWKVETQ